MGNIAVTYMRIFRTRSVNLLNGRLRYCQPYVIEVALGAARIYSKEYSRKMWFKELTLKPFRCNFRDCPSVSLL